MPEMTVLPGSDVPTLRTFRAARALTPSVMAEIEQLMDRRLSFDAHAVRAGFGELCNLCAPRGRVLSSVDLGGHTVLFTPSSLSALQQQLAHYRACKRQRSDTAACILLPAFVERKASSLLAGMRRVHRYAPGSPLFNGLSLSGAPEPLPPLPYSVDVWYDAPSPGPSARPAPFLSTVSSPVLSAVAGAPLPLVHVLAAGLPFKTLVDSGASHDFISDSVVRQLGLQLRDSAWSLTNGIRHSRGREPAAHSG